MYSIGHPSRRSSATSRIASRSLYACETSSGLRHCLSGRRGMIWEADCRSNSAVDRRCSVGLISGAAASLAPASQGGFDAASPGLVPTEDEHRFMNSLARVEGRNVGRGK